MIEYRLIAGMALAVLSAIVGGRLLAVSAKAIIDPIWLAVHRVDHAIRSDIGTRIKIGRPVIVQVNPIRGVRVPMMVMNVHVGIGSE
jgi:fumarate reductase subunit D